MRSQNNVSISPRRTTNAQDSLCVLESKCRIEYLEGDQVYRQSQSTQDFDKFAVLQHNNKLIIYRSNNTSPLLDNKVKELNEWDKLFRDQYHKKRFI